MKGLSLKIWNKLVRFTNYVRVGICSTANLKPHLMTNMFFVKFAYDQKSLIEVRHIILVFDDSG